MERSDKLDQLSTAMAKVQASITDPDRNAENSFFRDGNNKPSTYATLDACMKIARPLLAQNGLALIMSPVTDGTLAGIEWLLCHQSGQFLSDRLMMPPVKGTPQGVGAVLTYARRYLISALTGMASEPDDDGNAASNGHTEPQRTQPPSTTRSARSTTSAVDAPPPASAAPKAAPDPNARATGQHKEALAAALSGRHVDPLNVAARNAFGVAVLSAGYPGSFKDLSGAQCDVLIMAAEEGPEAMPDAQLQSIWRQHTPKPAPAQEPDPFGDE
jgi:hypothetical protein